MAQIQNDSTNVLCNPASFVLARDKWATTSFKPINAPPLSPVDFASRTPTNSSDDEEAGECAAFRIGKFADASPAADADGVVLAPAPNKRTPLPVSKPIRTPRTEDVEMTEASDDDKENRDPSTGTAQGGEIRGRIILKLKARANDGVKIEKPLAAEDESSMHKRHWAAWEINRLIRLKEEDGLSFQDISQVFPTRSVKAITVKYSKMRCPSKRRPRWSKNEIDLLMHLKKNNPEWSWTELAKEFMVPNRSGSSVHIKWMEILQKRPDLKAAEKQREVNAVNSRLARETSAESLGF